jgi:hypothetical protein
MGKAIVRRIPEMIEFTNEPRGATYSRLIDIAQTQCTRFSLVWRNDRRNKRHQSELGRRLKPFVLSDIITNEWPGTWTFPYAHNLCTYELSQETATALKMVEGLYDWLAPDFPEDLAFYVEKGEVWLTSVAHECMGWMTSASIKANELERILSFLHQSGVISEKYY